MKARLAAIIEYVKVSLWITPACMVAVTMILSVVMVRLDRVRALDSLSSSRWIWGGYPEGARTLLSIIGASSVTVLGVVFSITIVVLQLASSQFGPRLLRTFLKDLGNKMVLGTLLSTHIYCLLVLRTVRGGEESGEFVPHLAITGAVLLALVSSFLLIYFVHHIATSIQADHVVESVAEELGKAASSLYPEELGEAAEDPPQSLPSDEGGEALRAQGRGFLAMIDSESLLEIARKNDLSIEVKVRPGDFVGADDIVAMIFSSHDESIAGQLRECFVLSPIRTPSQDIRFLINQLLEVALRALSPSTNDPFTARNCVERLQSTMIDLSRRRFPSSLRADSAGTPRVLARPVSYGELLDQVVTTLVEYGYQHSMVMRQLENLLVAVRAHTPSESIRADTQKHLDTVRSHLRRGELD